MRVMRCRSGVWRTTNPKTPCMQPTAEKKNRMTNNVNSTVREGDQPLRQSRSANITETTPVNTNAQEKKRKMRQLSLRGLTGDMAKRADSSADLIEDVEVLAIGQR